MRGWCVVCSVVAIAHVVLAQETERKILPIAEFQAARAVAITPLGEIFVLDGALSRLYKLDQSGKKLQT